MKKLLFILCVASTIGANAQSNRITANVKDSKKPALSMVSEKPVRTKESIELNKKRDEAGILVDTRFLCSKGDWSSPKPGSCPKHKIDLLKDTDPKYSELSSQELIDNKDFGKDLQKAEDNRYTCLGGDISFLAPGKCPNHPNLELLSDKDPKVMQLRQDALKKNPELFKDIVLEENIKFVCVNTDYSSFTAGKCPHDNQDLMLSSSKEFKEKMAANSLKNAKPSNKK